LGGEAPDELVLPIKRPRTAGYNIPPTDIISPVIDGRETTYFEWLGAGVYMPDARSGSIHGPGGYIKELFYGHNDTHIYLRFDLQEEFRQQRRDFQVRVNFAGGRQTRLYVSVSNNVLSRVELWQGDKMIEIPNGAGPPDGSSPGSSDGSSDGSPVRAAYQNILEISLEFALLGLGPHHAASVQVSFWVDHLPVQALPREGWLTLEVAEGLLSW
ncbi:MAG: hypothetical protein ACRD2P_03755, partial [Terriglobia bacterium]